MMIKTKPIFLIIAFAILLKGHGCKSDLPGSVTDNDPENYNPMNMNIRPQVYGRMMSASDGL